jgi:hypothetical protein
MPRSAAPLATRVTWTALAWTAFAIVLLGGCAALSGLDGISEQACAPSCDGGTTSDGTTPPNGDDGATPGTDATVSDDSAASPDSTMPTSGDGGPPGDSSLAADSSRASDSGARDGEGDSMAADTGADSGQAAVDAGPDAGCGATNTTDNCSACGDKCTANNATAPACSGTTCSYMCNTGFLDCNVATAPDLDGCECNSPGATAAQCCSPACPQQHHYQVGVVNSVFYDCIAEGTIDQTDAIDACNAYTGSTTQCDTGGVSNFYCTYPDGGTVGDMVCSNGSTTKSCACWGYDGQLVGLMQVGTGTGNANCPCPVPTGPTWN